MEEFFVSYAVICDADEIDREARDLVLEQTVEVPESLITDPDIRERVVGRVDSIAPAGDGRWQVRAAYRTALVCDQIPQLLNLLYGNISIKKHIRLESVDWPASLLDLFPGPNWGLDGLRRRLGVYDRPLLATAIKPRGASNEQFAAIAGEFALAGGDLIKDDHNLAECDLEAFRARVGLCQEAVDRANARTGRATIYAPNLSVPLEQIEPHLDLLVRLGVGGIMIAPYILGLDALRGIAARYPFVLLAHPTFSGAYYRGAEHGIAPELALGDLMRICGADISIFPHHGGRFALTPDECRGIGAALRRPLGRLRPAFPAPAGGMKLDRVASMAETYGLDTVFLVGGALLSHDGGVAAGATAFLDAIRAHFGERLETPQADQPGACDLDGEPTRPDAAERLPFDPAAHAWADRPPVAYKASADLPFQGVARHELIGMHGEKTNFHLRYFEVAPSGFTSLERHRHTHTVIAVRGRGLLIQGDERRPLAPLDIAYIPPMAVHQLRNETAEPFGFFCIVDAQRDRPIAP